MTKLQKLISKIQKNPHKVKVKVKAKDFAKMLINEGFELRKGDSKKVHRHYFHSERPELMIVIVFSEGDSTILDVNYVKRYLKEISK